eukprot:31497-Pelagococcus_subviridis.AAC.55
MSTPFPADPPRPPNPGKLHPPSLSFAAPSSATSTYPADSYSARALALSAETCRAMHTGGASFPSPRIFGASASARFRSARAMPLRRIRGGTTMPFEATRDAIDESLPRALRAGRGEEGEVARADELAAVHAVVRDEAHEVTAAPSHLRIDRRRARQERWVEVDGRTDGRTTIRRYRIDDRSTTRRTRTTRDRAFETNLLHEPVREVLLTPPRGVEPLLEERRDLPELVQERLPVAVDLAHAPRGRRVRVRRRGPRASMREAAPAASGRFEDARGRRSVRARGKRARARRRAHLAEGRYRARESAP